MDARQDYIDKLEIARKRIAELEKRLQSLVWLRTTIFLTAASCLVLGYFGELFPRILLPLGGIAALGFLVAIIWNEHVRLAALAAKNDAELLDRLLARLDRCWAKLPPILMLPESPALDSCEDLDVAGESSLLSLLNLATTHPGQLELQRWLAIPATWPEVERRQAATKALAGRRSLRWELLRRISNTNYATQKPYGLTEWAESPSWLNQHPVAWTISYLGPIALFVSLTVFLAAKQTQFDWLAYAGFAGLVVATLANILTTVLWGGWIHGIFHRVSGEHHNSRQFSDIFELLGQLPEDQGILSDVRRIATKDQRSAVKGLAELNRVVRLASMQQNVLLYLVYLVLQQLFLWDFRILKRLENWKQQYGSSVRQWFDALGRCEAIISTATLVDENPNWSFPESQDNPAWCLQAKQLGHPLLSDGIRVCNDLFLEQNRPLLLITGSNMAGKSTFMRAVGLNILLARTGCSVCATQFRTPLYEIASSIRVRDSLREGVSFFMAELHRLKSVVDQAARHAVKDQPPLFFLLDEILQGTNSRERQIAVAHVVYQLIQLGTVGFLSTHDLDLAKVDEIAAVAQIVHFREYFELGSDGQQRMRFDYIMRSGPTPTTNAIKLLEIVGLARAEEVSRESSG